MRKKPPLRLWTALAVVAGVCVTGCVSRSALTVVAYEPPSQRGPGLSESIPLPPSDELPEGARLGDYRRYAARHNLALRAGFHEWQAQLQRVPQVSALPEARFTYTEYLEEVETRVGPQERSYAVSQAIPWFGTLDLAEQIQKQEALVAWEEFLAAQLALDRDVRRVFADYYYLGRSTSITGDNLELLRRLESVARQRLAAGTGRHTDVVRLQIEIGRLEDRRVRLVDMRGPVASRFNSLLARADGTPIPWPEALELEETSFDEARLEGYLDAHNPHLAMLQHRVRQAEHRRALARKAYFPDFAVGVKTIETGSAAAPGTSGSGDDPWLLTFSVEVPLQFDKYRAGELEAEERWHATTRSREDARNGLLADARQALFRQRDARRRVALFADTLIPKAEESLSATEASFRTGRAQFLDLIDAQRVLLELQLSGEKARADSIRAAAELDSLLGRFVLVPATVESQEGGR